jgi:2-polyprenyl-3-methyl-5-hydroxy-6-metoxy-1,4-benzoquinol methylase
MRLSSCLTCGEGRLVPVPRYDELPRVTSDCRPLPAGGRLAVCQGCGTIQKIADEQWVEEVERIYAGYDIYHQSAGVEQVVFLGGGVTRPRSALLVDFLARTGCDAIERGELIDIGCGNGAALANFSKTLSGWVLDGHELTDKGIETLRAIPGFRHLYAGDLSVIPARYHLASVIHVLEHFPMPIAKLVEIVSLLRPEGRVFVEVPNLATSPFDLVIADHLTHFTQETLRYAAARAGIEADILSNEVLPRELTLLGRRGHPHSQPVPDPVKSRYLAHKTVSWLIALLDEARAASAASIFGLFGSSISSQWLSGPLEGRVQFFVDEDINRIGRKIDGIPVISLAEVPADATVYVPLPTAVAINLAPRLEKTSGTYVYPPAWPT